MICEEDCGDAARLSRAVNAMTSEAAKSSRPIVHDSVCVRLALSQSLQVQERVDRAESATGRHTK